MSAKLPMPPAPPPNIPSGSNYATSIAGWSLAIAQGLESYGLDANAIFQNVDVDLQLIRSPSERLPVTNVQKVWHHAYQNTDELFGLAVSGFLHPASFHTLGFSLHASSTLKELLDRLIRYRCVISHSFFLELLEDGDNVILRAVDEREIKTDITHDAMYSFIVRMARELLVPDFVPEQVQISRCPTGDTAALRKFYGGEVTFGAVEDALVFRREDIERPLATGNPEMAAQMEQLTEEYIANLGLISEYMLRVKNKIREFLQKGRVNINKVAESLNITVRTLQRRLATEDSSYNDVLDQVRKELAMEYIKNPTLSATEIGFKLGFSDSGSFGRSFKRWTSMSFSEYKKQVSDH